MILTRFDRIRLSNRWLARSQLITITEYPLLEALTCLSDDAELDISESTHLDPMLPADFLG